jgi:hypothetical protein
MKHRIVFVGLSFLTGFLSLSCDKSLSSGVDVATFDSVLRTNGIETIVEEVAPIKKDIVKMAKLTLDGAAGQQVLVVAECKTESAAMESIAQMKQNPGFTHCRQKGKLVMTLTLRTPNDELATKITNLFMNLQPTNLSP